MEATSVHRAAPGPVSHDISSCDGRVRYHQGQVLVTDEWLEAHGRRYPIRELHHIHVVPARSSLLTKIGAMASSVVVFAIARVGGQLDVDGWIGAATLLTIPALLMVIGVRVRPRRHVMMAQFRGRLVRVVMEKDRHRLDQVVRAVRGAQNGRGA